MLRRMKRCEYLYPFMMPRMLKKVYVKTFSTCSTIIYTICLACCGLNGRFFDGRKVKALYFDQNRFDKLDLAP